ncbi:Phosphotyrosine interaction domain (PTB/PID) [Popillia japonica]|uniref:Phosphotyrosine interaction domain (PTB/PID) n=1 Tax=Popillia japonica TaxID=7064 RepID=A0AAW1N286_POPJA
MEGVDVVDTALTIKSDGPKRVPSIEALNSEMPGKGYQKDRGKRALRIFLNRLRLRKCASADITEPDPTYKVAYLGNVVTGWAKGEGCVEKPLATLWRNYTQSSRPDVRMQLTVSGGGLKATTKDHGLTEYWANRLTFCAAPPHFPRLFCWVYRLTFCAAPPHFPRLFCWPNSNGIRSAGRQIENKLKNSLALALAEFKRDKISRQNARLSLVNSVYENPTIPRRKILLSTGGQNYRPPLERSKSAPKLTIIEENLEETEEIFEGRPRNNPRRILRHYDSTGALLDKNKLLKSKLDSCKLAESCDSLEKDKKNPFLTADERSEMILQELIEDSLRNDLIESCNVNGWLRGLSETPDLIPQLDSDESSLSSGCESASTVTSDLDPQTFSTILEEESPEEDDQIEPEETTRKTELDFKVGGSVLITGGR